LDYDSSRPTCLFGIDGDTIVGRSGVVDGAIGISYNLSSQQWSTYSVAGADSTQFLGLQGNVIIGSYRNYSTGAAYGWNAFKLSGGIQTELTGMNHPNGIDGNVIVGFSYTGPYGDGLGQYFDGTNYSTIPNTSGLGGIEGNIIVGKNNGVGVIYDGLNFQNLSAPNSTYTSFEGIDNGSISGWFHDANGQTHGFIFKNGEWTILDVPNATSTYAYDINGDTVVGLFVKADGSTSGFIATVPEPSSLSLLLAGGTLLLGTRKRLKI